MAGELIQITGLAEVQRMLAEAPKTVVATAYLKALQAGANVIADELESRTPIKAEDVGGLLDKGVLRESVMIAVEIDSDLRGGQAEVGFGKNGYVAMWVEYGHRMVGHKPNKKLKGTVKANPFMRQTAAVSADRAIAAFQDELVAQLKGNLLDSGN